MTVERRARALIHAFHEGRLSREELARELWRLHAEEFGEPLAPERLPAPADRATAGERDTAGPGGSDGADAGLPPWPRPAAPGLWLLVTSDTCHFCGRRGIPVLALKGGEDWDEWVHVCLDDLEVMRAQARAVAEGGAEGQAGG